MTKCSVELCEAPTVDNVLDAYFQDLVQVVIESNSDIANCGDIFIEYAFRFKQNNSD